MGDVVSFLKAVRLWARISGGRAVAKVLGATFVLAVGLIALGAVVGRLGRPDFEDVKGGSSVVQTREVVVTKVVTQTVVKWRTKNVSVQRFDPGTGRLVYSLSSSVQSQAASVLHSDEQRRESDAVVSTTRYERVVKASAGRWLVYAGAGLAGGGPVGAVGASVQVLGPLSVGGQVLFPVSAQGGTWGALATVGLRL